MSTELAASALAWWSEAGVDTLVGEEPRDWLKPKASPQPAVPDARPAPAASLPDTLAAFQAWLATAPLPFPTLGARLAPQGDPSARLMVIVDMPSPSGDWFEGEAGPLFDRMLAAMNGLSRNQLYLAVLSPARLLTGSIEPAQSRRLGDIARHHIGLVRPRAVLLFGDMCAEVLLGESVARSRGRWHALDTAAGPVRTLATIRPELVARQPNYRKIVWGDLQLLMEELK